MCVCVGDGVSIALSLLSYHLLIVDQTHTETIVIGLDGYKELPFILKRIIILLSTYGFLPECFTVRAFCL